MVTGVHFELLEHLYLNDTAYTKGRGKPVINTSNG